MWYEVFVSLCFKGTVRALEIKRDSCPLETEELHVEDLIYFFFFWYCKNDNRHHTLNSQKLHCGVLTTSG